MSKSPAVTGANAVSHGTGTVILCDSSSSMDLPAALGRSRIMSLREALQQVATPQHKLLAFASDVVTLSSPHDLPEPSGGTDLARGLAAAAEHNPAAVIVITDGEPNSPKAAIAAAGRVSGKIDVIFCGDPADLAAIRFCGMLARIGGGRMLRHDWSLTPSLAAPIRLLLGGPTT